MAGIILIASVPIGLVSGIALGVVGGLFSHVIGYPNSLAATLFTASILYASMKPEPTTHAQERMMNNLTFYVPAALGVGAALVSHTLLTFI